MDSSIESGDVLGGKYVVEEVIGEGGMGCVYAGRHVGLDTPVALKVLRADASDDSRERFMREARAASRIDSEHVARVFDVGELDDGTPYMVMELLKGRDLDDLLDEQGPLPVDTAVGYALQACEALAAAHARGVVHRDVKPANLFLTRREPDRPCIKLLDFGISKMASPLEQQDESLTATGSCLGSPLFMSPEQLLSCRSVDRRSDLWSLGVSLFELLTSRAAFDGQTVAELYSAILRDPPRRLREYRPDAPRALEAVILRCLRKEPHERVQTARQLADLLRPFAAVDPGGAEERSDDPLIEWSVMPASRQPAWAETEIMDHRSWAEDPLAAAPEAEDPTPAVDQRELPDDEPLDLAAAVDRTPPGTVCVVRPSSSSNAGRWRWPELRWRLAAALAVAGLFAGGLLGAAGSAAWLEPVSAAATAEHLPPLAPPSVLVVERPAPAPAVSAEPSPLVYSTKLGRAERERLLQEVDAAEEELGLGEHERVLARVDAVTKSLAALGVEPGRANSSIGARAQLLVGRVEAAKARELASRAPSSLGEARGLVRRLDERVARARVAYDRIKAWGVRSFYRCGLVEMASLDGDVAAVFRRAAPTAPGPERDWFVAQARRRLKDARVGLRAALHVQSETMLCVSAAQLALEHVDAELDSLAESPPR